MSENRYKIVFDGTLLPGVDLSTAKLNLADLFKSEVAAIERLFTGRTVALKRDLSQLDAQTYLQALRKTGIDARIEAEPAIELNLADVPDHVPVSLHKAPTDPQSPYAPPQSTVGEAVPAFATLRPFSFTGRIGRVRFLAWTMALTLVTLGIGTVLAIFGIALIGADSTAGLILGGLLLFILLLVLAVISIQFSVQRLHDIGWSGWLWLINLVPFVGSFFPFVIMVVPGNTTANQYGPPPPPNSTAVKVLAWLWLAFIALIFVGALAGGITALQQEYETAAETSYDSSTVITDDVEVESADEAEEAPNSADDAADAAEEAQPPVDSAQE